MIDVIEAPEYTLENLDITVIVLEQGDELVTTHVYGRDHSIADLQSLLALEFDGCNILHVVK